jgi:hypothetical protein
MSSLTEKECLIAQTELELDKIEIQINSLKSKLEVLEHKKEQLNNRKAYYENYGEPKTQLDKICAMFGFDKKEMLERMKKFA